MGYQYSQKGKPLISLSASQSEEKASGDWEGSDAANESWPIGGIPFRWGRPSLAAKCLLRYIIRGKRGVPFPLEQRTPAQFWELILR